jgi:hypothetical protein
LYCLISHPAVEGEIHVRLLRTVTYIEPSFDAYGEFSSYGKARQGWFHKFVTRPQEPPVKMLYAVIETEDQRVIVIPAKNFEFVHRPGEE